MRVGGSGVRIDCNTVTVVTAISALLGSCLNQPLGPWGGVESHLRLSSPCSPQVVTKLFHIVEPDVAVFGRKDYQQWRIISRMVKLPGVVPRWREGAALRFDSTLKAIRSPAHACLSGHTAPSLWAYCLPVRRCGTWTLPWRSLACPSAGRRTGWQ